MKIHFTWKKALNLALAFIQFLLLVAATAGLLLRLGPMNYKFMDRAIVKSGYTGLLTEQVLTQMADYGAVSGVTDTAVFSSVITQPRVDADVRTYFQGALDGVSLFNMGRVKTKLKKSIEDYAKQGDLSQVSEAELDENIDRLVDLCSECYQNAIMVPALPRVGHFLHLIRRTVDITVYICLFLFALIGAVMIYINGYVRTALRYMTYAVSGAAAVWLLLSLGVICSGLSSRVALTSRPLYALATHYMNALLIKGLWMALILAAATAALLVCYYVIAPRLAKRYRMRHLD